jgi:hypothetical protein
MNWPDHNAMIRVRELRISTSGFAFADGPQPEDGHCFLERKAPFPACQPRLTRLHGDRRPPWLSYIRQDPARAFNAVYTIHSEAGGQHLGPQFLRAVEISRGEVIQPLRGVTMLAILKVSLHDLAEPGIVQEVSRESIQG